MVILTCFLTWTIESGTHGWGTLIKKVGDVGPNFLLPLGSNWLLLNAESNDIWL